MKIQCQSCQAKYTIADEKVLGKVVKIRCKKCSATIVINGNETRPAETDANAYDYGAANDQWTVNVADGDQRTMTPDEIATEYAAGVVNDETYCWKDGMADWLPLREIDELYASISGGGAGGGGARQESLHDDISLPPQSVPPPAAAAASAGLFSSSEISGAVDSPFAGSNGNGNGHGYGDVAPQPAARRGGGRGQGADLFGNVASAGAEEDVMTSAAASSGGGGMSAGGLEEAKLTGQRNESSVLFSLSALTEGAKAGPTPANRTTATADGSGLIDIRALSQTMGADEKKDTSARVDDIMNLSGGGAFGAALAAPILAPPPLEVSEAGGVSGSGGKSNKTLLFAILGGAAIIAIGLGALGYAISRPPPATADTSTGTTSVTPVGDSTTAPGIDTAAPTAVTANDTPTTPTAAPTGDVPAPPGTGNAKPVTAAPAVAANNKPAAVAAAPAKPAAEKPEPAAPTTPKNDGPQDFAKALAAAANKPQSDGPKESSGSSTAPFDRGAATAALSAVNVQSCKKPDGPTGPGHVKVTFAPNGSVSQAVVDGGPYPGTSVGGCIAGKYRGARIPAFAGAPVPAGKSFTIN